MHRIHSPVTVRPHHSPPYRPSYRHVSGISLAGYSPGALVVSRRRRPVRCRALSMHAGPAVPRCPCGGPLVLCHRSPIGRGSCSVIVSLSSRWRASVARFRGPQGIGSQPVSTVTSVTPGGPSRPAPAHARGVAWWGNILGDLGEWKVFQVGGGLVAWVGGDKERAGVYVYGYGKAGAQESADLVPGAGGAVLAGGGKG